MTQFENLINNIKNYKYKFIDNNFDRSIKKNIKELFPGLNDYDFDILFFTTKYLIEDISIRFGFKNEEKYYKQWTQNSGRDIKSTTLMLLPYINDKNNYKLFKKLSDLNQILCDVNDQSLKTKN